MSEAPPIVRPTKHCMDVMDMKLAASIGATTEAMKALKLSVDHLRNEMHGQREADTAIMAQLNTISQRLTILETTQRNDREASKRRLVIWGIVSPVFGGAGAWMLVKLFGA